jgi:hypothetical protein
VATKYDWGDGKGKVHTRPKKAAAPRVSAGGPNPSNAYGVNQYGNVQRVADPIEHPIGAPPIDPEYEAYKVSSARNWQLGEAQAAYQTGKIRQRYGVDDASNPYSESANLKYEYGIGDTSNPYSRAKMLQKSYEESKMGNMNSFAAQGQLYSGAYQKTQADRDVQRGNDETVMQRGFSQGTDAINRAFADAMHGVQYGRAQSAASNAIGVDDATYQALLRALGG